VEGDPEWLEHRDIRVTQGVGHRDEAVGGPGHELTQRAIRDSVPRKAKGKAEVGMPGTTLLTLLAGHRRIDRHTQTGARPRLDHAGRLVAQDDRPGESDIADT
jgi:hypothetical protein